MHEAFLTGLYEFSAKIQGPQNFRRKFVADRSVKNG